MAPPLSIRRVADGVKLLLDAHVSGKRIGSRLRDLGHGVRAADEERDLDGLDVAGLLALASHEGRVLITCNVSDFVPLLVERSAGGRSHAGAILVPNSIRHEEFGAITAAIQRALGTARQIDWIDRVEWPKRA